MHMCGICGFVNLKHNINNENYKNVLLNMITKISNRGPDEDGFYLNSNVMFAHKRLIVIDKENRKTTNEIYL